MNTTVNILCAMNALALLPQKQGETTNQPLQRLPANPAMP